ncbi:MAG: peptide-methionine (R)-S-oxide reductase MsrB [Candidatus Eremiobacteraeota bacterium]|nr:peptide-methionine (R)-S-oxide reductase MsrB [Candidatus Eremiobacteraeota bacterium]
MSHRDISRRALLGTGLAALGLFAVKGLTSLADSPPPSGHFEITHTPAQWRSKLGDARYQILREGGTEPPWSSPLEYEHRLGGYSCAGCDLPLFSSTTKFESGTGWPSFYRPLPNAVATMADNSLGDERNEVHCRRCGGHLGHVFTDGPKPTGLRYCMDGLSLEFRKKTV